MFSYGSCHGSAPHHLTPASSCLWVCPDQIPMLLFMQLTLLLPFCTDPAPTPTIQEAAPGPQAENRLLCCLSPLAFPARPDTHSVSNCTGSFGGPFLPPSVHTGPSVPEQGAVCQDTEGRCKIGPAAPSCSSRWGQCPSDFLWVHLTIYECPHPP